MTICRRPGGYQYDFRLNGKRYTSRLFDARRECRAAEQSKRAELRRPRSQPTDITFYALCLECLDYAQAWNAPRVYLNKKATLGKVLRMTGWTHTAAADITRADCESYLMALQAENLKASTINDHRKTIRGVFQFGLDRELLAENPCSKVAKMPQQRRADLYIPTAVEVKAVILAAPLQRKSRYMLQAALAARPGEVDNLEWTDVDFKRGEVRLWTRKTSGGHEKSRMVPMNETARALLLDAQGKRSDGSPYVYPCPATGKPYQDRHGFKADCIQAGVQPFHRHALRHFSASLIIDAGASLKEVQEILGHADARTTEIYIHNLKRGREARRDIMRALDMDNPIRESIRDFSEKQ